MDQALVRAEYAKQSGSLGDSSGWNIDSGYLITENIQPIVRYEAYQSGFTGSSYSFGMNYLMLKHNSKVTVQYSVLDNLTGTKNSLSPGSQALSYGSQGGLLILAFQAAI